PCLKKHPPGMYVGVDLSGAALEEAKEHLDGLLHVALRQEEMVEALEKSKARFEVIFSGYALHHLDLATKEKFIRLCLQRLAPGGALLLVDVVREEGETREAYLARYLEFMRRDWTEVPKDELEEACAHVQAHDFPETESALREMGQKAGFARMERLARFGPHQVWEFCKGD
ncbi:MAG: class I SAM-dependent methyltransferase, partial [Verrucomicrobia bacterium]|nr:class I SAM-dependent methyltransferase [Verrucomicrobiota bacterium]